MVFWQTTYSACIWKPTLKMYILFIPSFLHPIPLAWWVLWWRYTNNLKKTRGCDIECFVNEVIISRLRLTTQANGEKSLRTSFFAKITSSISKQLPFEPLQILKHRYKAYFEQLFPAYLRGTMEKFWEKSIWKSDFPAVWGISVVSTKTVHGYSVSLPLRRGACLCVAELLE